MKSHYGNLVVNSLELVFAIVSLLLTWVSLINDGIPIFAITTIVYILPRFLSASSNMVCNGCDITKFVIDIISLVALFASFVFGSLLVFDFATGSSWGTGFQENARLGFYISSAISLAEFVFKLITGIIQRFSLILACLRR